MRRIVVSAQARADLLEIIAYIAADNPAAAERIDARLWAAIERLAQAPLGRPGRVRGTHEKVVRGLPYIISYELLGREEIAVLRVIHMSRDWPEGGWPA